METSYHHGSLRATLLVEGRALLVEQGLDAVSLRELARRAGVSHAAPRRHFADREALLAGLAAAGFDELTGLLRDAAREASLEARLTTYARGYVQFALANGPLVALMFSRKAPASTGPEAEAAGRFYVLGAELLGQDGGTPPDTVPYLVAAVLEGLSSLAISGRLPAERVDDLIRAAVAMLLPTIRDAAGIG